MSSWSNTIENACFLLGGAALAYLLIWFKDRSLKKAKRCLRIVVGRYPAKEPEHVLARADLRRLSVLRSWWRREPL